MGEDDRLAAADAEIKRQAKLLADITERRDSYQSLVAVREQWIKEERLKNDKLRDEIHDLRERIAQMEGE